MNAEPIYVFAKWQVKKGQADTVLALVKEAAEESRKEEGNLFYKIHQATANPGIIVLFEGYSSEVAVNEHRNSRHFQDIIIKQIIPLLDNREVIPTMAIDG